MRPLPKGLRLCDACGEARGTTPHGDVSACYCSGVDCTWCGETLRRPITDYYDRRDRRWWHVSHFGLQAHRCPAPEARRVGAQFHKRTPDPDVERYQTAVTELTWRESEARRARR